MKELIIKKEEKIMNEKILKKKEKDMKDIEGTIE